MQRKNPKLNPGQREREDEGGRGGGRRDEDSATEEGEWRIGIRETSTFHPSPHSHSHRLHSLMQHSLLQSHHAPLFLQLPPNPRSTSATLLPSRASLHSPSPPPPPQILRRQVPPHLLHLIRPHPRPPRAPPPPPPLPLQTPS